MPRKKKTSTQIEREYEAIPESERERIAEGRVSFPVYYRWCDIFDEFEMSDAELGKLFRFMYEFQIDGELPEFTDSERELKMAWSFMVGQMIQDKKSYVVSGYAKSQGGSGGKKGTERNIEEHSSEKENFVPVIVIDKDMVADAVTDADADISIDTVRAFFMKKFKMTKPSEVKTVQEHVETYGADKCLYVYELCVKLNRTDGLGYANKILTGWSDENENEFQGWKNLRMKE